MKKARHMNSWCVVKQKSSSRLVSPWRMKHGIFLIPQRKYITRVYKDHYQLTTLSMHETKLEAEIATVKYYNDNPEYKRYIKITEDIR